MLPINPQLMEIGKVKIGAKGAQKNTANDKVMRLPKKLDHFIVTTNNRDAEGNFQIDKTVMDKIGVEPKEIRIQFLFDSMQDNWETSRNYFLGNGKLFCTSEDEVEASRADVAEINGQKRMLSSRHKLVCPNNKCEYAMKDAKGVTRCKPYGVLRFMLTDTNRIGGLHVFRTTSWATISNITGQLLLFEKISRGKLSGLPFVLKLSPKTTTYTDQNDAVHTTNFYEVGMFFDGDQTALMQAVQKQRQALIAGETGLLQIEQQERSLRRGQYWIEAAASEDGEGRDAVEEFNPKIVEASEELPPETVVSATPGAAIEPGETSAPPPAGKPARAGKTSSRATGAPPAPQKPAAGSQGSLL